MDESVRNKIGTAIGSYGCVSDALMHAVDWVERQPAYGRVRDPVTRGTSDAVGAFVYAAIQDALVMSGFMSEEIG